jgi:hypothetical protein
MERPAFVEATAPSGVMTKLSAVAFGVKPEGSVRRSKVASGPHGSGIAPMELQGKVGSLKVNGEAVALGRVN